MQLVWGLEYFKKLFAVEMLNLEMINTSFDVINKTHSTYFHSVDTIFSILEIRLSVEL